MSDTPWTDANEHRVHYMGEEGEADYMAVESTKVRQLERELNALRDGPVGGKWISAEDGLPETTGWCSVWIVDADGDVLAAEYWGDDKEFWPPNGKGEYWARQQVVKFWMPFELPNPPTATGERPA